MKNLKRPNLLKRLFLTFDDYFFAHRDIEVDIPFNALITGTNNPYDYVASRDLLINGIYVLSKGTIATLQYENQTANFTIGATVTGQTSGATGIILKDNDRGTNGILYLFNVSGTFEDGEDISDSKGSSAIVKSRGYSTSTPSSNNVKFKITKNKREAITNDYISCRIFDSLAEGYLKLPIPIILHQHEELNFNFINPNDETYYIYLFGYYLKRLPEKFPIRPMMYYQELKIETFDEVLTTSKLLTIYNNFYMHTLLYHGAETSYIRTLEDRQKPHINMEIRKIIKDKDGKDKIISHTIIDSDISWLGDGSYPLPFYYEFTKKDMLKIELKSAAEYTLKPNVYMFLMLGGINEE